jgi:hypothetical protein
MAPAATLAALPLVHSKTPYRQGQLAHQVATVLQRYAAGSLGPTPGKSGRLAKPAERVTLQGCVDRVAPGATARLIDQSTYDGRPAIIIVVYAYPGHPATAFVVRPGCSAARSDLLAQTALSPTG